MNRKTSSLEHWRAHWLRRTILILGIVWASLNAGVPPASGQDAAAANTQLHRAIEKRDVARVKELLARGVNVNSRSSRPGNYAVVGYINYTPLMLAVEQDLPEVVELLLQRGADVHARSDRNLKGFAAFDLVQGTSNGIRIVKLLLKSGADPSARNEGNLTGFYQILRRGNLELVTAVAENVAPEKIGEFIPEVVLEIERAADHSTITRSEFFKGILRKLIARSDARYRQADGSTALHLVSAAGLEADFVRVLIKRGAEVDLLRKNDGKTPLMLATQADNPETVKALLAAGAKLNLASEGKKETALMLAAHYGNEAIVRLLLEAGADRQLRDAYENTALDMAKGDNSEGIAKLLAAPSGVAPAAPAPIRVPAPGVPIPAPAGAGEYPLFAVVMKHAVNNRGDQHNELLKQVRDLIDAGADVNARDRNGNTALLDAADRADDAMVELLLVKGADVDMRDKDGRTPLLRVLLRQLHKETTDVVRLLLAKGADPNARDAAGNTPLMMAVLASQSGGVNKNSILPMLLTANADKTLKNAAGHTAYWKSHQDPAMQKLLANPDDLKITANLAPTVKVLRGGLNSEGIWRVDTTQFAKLAQQGVNVNGSLPKVEITNGYVSEGETLLCFAASLPHAAIWQAVWSLKLDVNARNADERTPLFGAAKVFSAARVKLLLERGAQVNARDDWEQTALMVAAQHGNAAVMSVLLDKGAQVNVADRNGWTPLMHASHALYPTSGAGRSAAVQLLLGRGADVNSRAKEGATALLVAAESKNLTAVRLLLAKGARPNIANWNGVTPLHKAFVADPVPGMAQLLVENGADVNARDDQGNTPLSQAAMWHPGAVALLLNKGAQPNTVDKNGDTPLALSIVQNHKDVATLLLNKGADPNIADNRGIMPLYLAVLGKYPAAFIKQLIERGADVNARPASGGVTALKLAVHLEPDSSPGEVANLLSTIAALKAAGAKE